jgi:hypothetical protein
MAIPELAPKGGRFFASDLITARNDALTHSDLCVPGVDCSIAIGTILRTMHIHLLI